MKQIFTYNIDIEKFWINPYPDLKIIRRKIPIVHVPELDAILITKRNSIFKNEKKVDIFSSDQPDGLMTKLMGKNMMRKDGEPHLQEKKSYFSYYFTENNERNLAKKI